MPNFVKGLGDVKEGRGAVGFAIKGIEDFVDKAVGLGDGGVFPRQLYEPGYLTHCLATGGENVNRF
jgi:hypothetical protein